MARKIDTPTDSTEKDDEPPEGTFLTDEQRILRLLESHDGKMKQKTITEEVTWSHAKVSITLSSMADNGTITKFRAGRYNVIMLPENDPREAS